MAEPNAADGAVTPKSESKLKLLLLPLALVALVGGGAVTATQYTTVAGLVHRTGSAEAAPEGEEAEAAEPVEYGVFAQIEGLTVNPETHGEGTRYLLVNIGVEAPKEAVLEELSQRDVVIRDTIIKLLSARTVAELSTVETRAALKEEVRDAINAVLQKGQITRIYFTQYVIQ